MEGQQELKSHVEVTINKPGKILYFSDGVDEQIEEQNVKDSLSAAPPEEDTTDPKTLAWGPWFTYHAWKSGNKVLNAVDYAGEGLASFFGITTPKYQIEINEYERMQTEKKKMEEESAGWTQTNTGGEIPLVLSEPGKSYKPDNV